MRIPTSETNDTLDAASLPPTEGTELNYRTRPDVDTELRFTLHTLKVAIIWAVVIVLLLRLFGLSILGYATIALFWRIWWLVPDLTRPDPDTLGRMWEFRLWLFAVVVVCLALHATLPSHLAGYLVAFPCAVLAFGGQALIYARQVVAWMVVNPKVYGDVGREWAGHFPHPGRWVVAEPLPAARGTLVAPLFLLAAYVFGILVFDRLGFDGRNSLTPAMAGIGFVFLLVLLVLTRRLCGRDEGFSLRLTARVLWELLVVFVTYNRHRTPAAGVFRFPAKRLADVDKRKRFVIVVFVAAGLTTILVLPPVWPAAVTARPTQGDLLPHERNYLAQLPPAESRRQTAELIKSRTVTQEDIERLKKERWLSIPGRILLILLALPLGIILMTVAIAWVSVGELLTGYYLTLEAPGGRARTTDSEWDVYVSRLLSTEHPLEKEHLLVGFSLFGDYPVLLHKAILNQHYHLTGDTGSMKTSLVVGPHATQLMGRGNCSVVILDLKGDMALFETCRIEAATAGLKFSWFTTERGNSSFVFNPFDQSYHAEVTPEQESETLLQGMSLDYGVDYGRSFYTTHNEMTLKILMRRLNLKSAAALHALLEGPNGTDMLTAREIKDAAHLRAIANRLMTITPLNAELPPGAPRRIEVEDILKTPQVVYLTLKSAQEPLVAATIARLFLWSLFSCSAHIQLTNNRVYLYIDEFQQIIADGVKLVFELIRGRGVTLIPVHQTPGQLIKKGADMLSTVDSCTAVKHILRASDLITVERIEKMSGVQTYHSLTWAQDTTSGEREIDPAEAIDGIVQISETYGPNLDRNTVLAASADPLASFIRFTFGSGYTQFGAKTTIIRSLFPVDLETHETRGKAPWPILPDEPPVSNPIGRGEPGGAPQVVPGRSTTDWDERFRNDSL
jgi:hypothetical protein